MVAAAEVGLGLAIVLQVFRLRATVALDELTDLAEPDARDPPPTLVESTHRDLRIGVDPAVIDEEVRR